jgi:hypothetical protein
MDGRNMDDRIYLGDQTIGDDRKLWMIPAGEETRVNAAFGARSGLICRHSGVLRV